jgi:hypothetical protein
MTNEAATATYTGTWGEPRTVYLMPQKTKRQGVRMTVYRWMDRGTAVDGLVGGFGLDRMVRHAERHHMFSDVRVA